MKQLRKIAIIALTLVCAAGTFTAAEASCGHHQTKSHTSSSQCRYHHKKHKKSTQCSRYCKKHKTTHSNGKCHK